MENQLSVPRDVRRSSTLNRAVDFADWLRWRKLLGRIVARSIRWRDVCADQWLRGRFVGVTVARSDASVFYQLHVYLPLFVQARLHSQLVRMQRNCSVDGHAEPARQNLLGHPNSTTLSLTLGTSPNIR
ncbi:hypothetical protein [Neorhodopirellula pilleata]|nr:hypothetical protein [Neorhodopirellula pilleata]